MSKKTQTAVAVADPVIVVDELVINQGKFEFTNLSEIRISKTNRKRFDPIAMQELAADIKVVGVVQPIVIRPVDPTEEEPQIYEIVAGERRYRASIIAGARSIPAMIRKLTDLQAAKIQILENLKREDPHEMEEAEGYQNLMLTHGYTADQLAVELNKNRSHIYARLKLCALAKDLREDFLDRKFSASTALLIARIPVPQLQVKAMKEITEQQPGSGEAMSFRDAKRHIESRYMLRLVDASFDTKDAKLTDAPSCVKCPKRTGNQPEIFSDIDENICTDPDCFKIKKSAYDFRKIKFATKRGIPVLEGADASEKHNQMVNDGRQSEYVDGAGAIWSFDRIVFKEDRNKTIESLIPPDQLPKPVYVIRLSTGKVMELYLRTAIQAQLENMAICKPESIASETADAGHDTTVATPGATLATVTVDPYAERIRREDEAKAAAAKESEFRIALYKQLRQRGFSGFSLQSLREFVKLVLLDDNEYALPDDLLGDLYPFGSEGSDDVVCEFINQAPLETVQLILVDLVLGNALGVNWRYPEPEDNLRYATLLNMAKAEGIDADQARKSLIEPERVEEMAPEAPAEKPKRAWTPKAAPAIAPEESKQLQDSDTAPAAQLTPAAKISPTAAWPFPKGALPKVHAKRQTLTSQHHEEGK